MNKQKTLIANLSEELQPVTPVTGINRKALTWFLASALFVIAATFLAGPIRPVALQQLSSEPRFLLETLLGVAALLWVGLAAWRSAIPGALSRRFLGVGLVLLVAWLAQYVIGLASPALEPNELGKRDFCYLETFFYGLPIIMAGLFFARRLYPLSPLRTAAAVGLAGGMLPALYMQLACMYEASHILSFHILPGLLAAGVAVAAFGILKKKADRRR